MKIIFSGKKKDFSGFSCNLFFQITEKCTAIFKIQYTYRKNIYLYILHIYITYITYIFIEKNTYIYINIYTYIFS